MTRFIREAFAYGAVSAVALVVDFSLLYALVHWGDVGYLAAAAISFLAGACLAYVLSVRFAFREHRLNNRRDEFVGFVAIGVFGLAINAAAMVVAVRYLGLNYLLGKCTAAGCTFTFNFLARRQLLFVRRLGIPEPNNVLPS